MMTVADSQTKNGLGQSGVLYYSWLTQTVFVRTYGQCFLCACRISRRLLISCFQQRPTVVLPFGCWGFAVSTTSAFSALAVASWFVLRAKAAVLLWATWCVVPGTVDIGWVFIITCRTDIASVREFSKGQAISRATVKIPVCVDRRTFCMG